MEKELRSIIEKARNYVIKNCVLTLSIDLLVKLDIEAVLLDKYFKTEDDFIQAFLDYERICFEEIFLQYDFEGQNAIDILFVVSQDINDRFYNLAHSITEGLEKDFSSIYSRYKERRMKFVFDKIKVNVEKGIQHRMYREDLNPAVVGRMYLKKLEEIQDPKLYPPDRFKFGTIFDTMIDSYVKSIATKDGLNYYRQRKQLLGVLSFGR